ncbi:MAG: hypothetical protein CMJ94_07640 [Planctomycetes bacterium]|nr:hypothetical protein [Planctomycetota bacterium]
MRTSTIFALILAPCLALASCGGEGSGRGGAGGAAGGGTWGGPGSGSGGGSGGGGGTATLTFAGPKDASPTATDTVAITWDPAVLTAATEDEVLYDVFRADNEAMTGELLIGTTSPGVSSFLDSGLANDATYFYRVIARTTESGLVEEPEVVVSSNLPRQPTGTPIDYSATVEPLWSRLGNDGVTTCLDCHDGTVAKPDLQSWEGVMIGMGTPAAPDTWVTAGMGVASWRDLVNRIRSHPSAMPAHRMWLSQVTDYENTLVPWVDEGATEAADLTPPEFDPADLANSDLYMVEDRGNNRVAIRFPHAMDLESQPYGPQSFDHLTYLVFAGETSNTIDWSSQFRTVANNTFPTSDDSFVLIFDWPANTGTFVVRAADWFGNVSISEVELNFERASVN